MDLPAELIDTLTELIADPASDLSAVLASVLASAEDSIESLTSATLTLSIEDYPFTVTAVVPARSAAARTSIAFPLFPGVDSATCSELVLRASTPGAFVDLAVDVCSVLQLESKAIAVDRHLATAESMIESPHDHGRIIDQAVGALVARGASVKQADTHLRRRAKHDNRTLGATARSILDEATEPD